MVRAGGRAEEERVRWRTVEALAGIGTGGDDE
jgi:hypothetical protein